MSDDDPRADATASDTRESPYSRVFIHALALDLRMI